MSQVVIVSLLGALMVLVMALHPWEPIAQYEEGPLVPSATGTALVAPNVTVTATLEVPDAAESTDDDPDQD